MQQHKNFARRPQRRKAAIASLWLGLSIIGGANAAHAEMDPPWFLPFSTMTEQEKRGMQLYYHDAGGVGSGIGCADCHGDIGQGNIDVGAPAAAGAIRSTFDTMTSGGAELMNFLKNTPAEKDDVFSFLQVLRLRHAPEPWGGRDGRQKDL